MSAASYAGSSRTGPWPGAPDASTAFPATFEIDYIRAYQSELAPAVKPAREKHDKARDKQKNKDKKRKKKKRKARRASTRSVIP